MQFLAEMTMIGVVNTFTYISLLMDLVSASEKYDFEFFMLLALHSITSVEKFLQSKYEMEYKNLLDDIGRIFSDKESMLYEHYQCLCRRDESEIFELRNKECQIVKVVNLRKNYKLEIEKREERVEWIRKVKRLNLFKMSDLNTYIISHYLLMNIYAYHKNMNLMMDKIFSRDLKAYSSVRDFLLIDILFSMSSVAHHLPNSLLPFHILTQLINCWDYTLFFEDCWKIYLKHFYTHLSEMRLMEINNMVEGITFLNFSTHKTFSLTLIDEELREKISASHLKYIKSVTQLQRILYNEDREEREEHMADEMGYEYVYIR